MGFDQIRQRRLSDDIVEQLEGMILEGTLKSDRKSTRLNSSHYQQSRMPSSA